MDGQVDEWTFSENVLRAVGDIGCGSKVVSCFSLRGNVPPLPDQIPSLGHFLGASPSKQAGHVDSMIPALKRRNLVAGDERLA